MKIHLLIAIVSLSSASGSLACQPLQFGKVRVGQHVSAKKFPDLPSQCKPHGECVYGKRSRIQYIVEDGVVSEVSAPVRLIRGLPIPARRIDLNYLRRVNRSFCPAFRLVRDDYGSARLETADRIDPVTRYSLRTVIFMDERRIPTVALTSLPET